MIFLFIFRIKLHPLQRRSTNELNRVRRDLLSEFGGDAFNQDFFNTPRDMFEQHKEMMDAWMSDDDMDIDQPFFGNSMPAQNVGGNHFGSSNSKIQKRRGRKNKRKHFQQPSASLPQFQQPQYQQPQLNRVVPLQNSHNVSNFSNLSFFKFGSHCITNIL